MTESKSQEREVELLVPPQPQIVSTMTKQEAIDKLQSLQRNDEGANVHTEAETVLCDFLDAVGYGDIAREFRKIHEMYPTGTHRYSKPSWRL